MCSLSRNVPGSSGPRGLQSGGLVYDVAIVAYLTRMSVHISGLAGIVEGVGFFRVDAA